MQAKISVREFFSSIQDRRRTFPKVTLRWHPFLIPKTERCDLTIRDRKRTWPKVLVTEPNSYTERDLG